jgi:integrase
MDFLTAASRWFAERGQRRARPHEIERDLAWLQRALGPRRLIRSIDQNEVARLVSLRLAEGVGAGTVNRTVTEHLRAILRRARSAWGQSVVEIDWREEILREPEPRPREASAEEEARLLAAMRADYRPALRFALLSGLRLDELIGMRRHHIHFGERRLYLVGKGDKQAHIPLTREMIAILREELARHGLACVWTYEGRRRRGGRIEKPGRHAIAYEGMKTQFARARRRAGLKSTRDDPLMGLRLHDARHTALSRVARSGGIAMAQKLGRHADIRTTMRYAASDDSDLLKAMETAETSRQTSQPTTPALRIVKRKQGLG